MRLLLVEDDPALGEGIRTALKPEGYTVDWLQDGAPICARCEMSTTGQRHTPALV